MIPLKVQIKNFLSYGPEIQTIDFTNYALICLSGKNGHGKSALLDAITWALWGQARKTIGTAKADQGLLRLGQTIMMVILDFECNGQTYRVKREFAQTYGKPYANLEFGVYDSQKESFSPLTDKTIRLTQARINQTLAIDYESFTNSAFLRQGQANEFSKKTPKERKEILATILGLNRYECIRKLAADKIKHAHNEKKATELVQEKYESELKQKPDLTIREKEINEKIKAIHKSEKEIEKEHHALAKLQNAHTKKKNEAQMLSYQLDQLRTQEKEEQAQLQEQFATWRLVHRSLLHSDNHAALKKQKEAIITALSAQQKKVHAHMTAQQELLAFEQQLNQHKHRLQSQYGAQVQAQQLAFERGLFQIKHDLCKKDELDKESQCIENNKDAAKKDLKACQEKIKQNTIEPHAIEKERALFEKRKEHYQRWVVQGNVLNTQAKELHNKNTMVNDESPSCPLCEQNLSSSRKRFLKNKFDADAHTINHNLARFGRILPKLKEMLFNQHTQLKKMEEANRIHDEAQKNYNEIQKKLSTFDTEQSKLTQQKEALEKKLKESQKKQTEQEKSLDELKKNEDHALKQDETYQKIAASIESKQKELVSISYDKKVHDSLEKERSDLELKLQELAHIHEKGAQQEERKKVIRALCIQLKEKKKKKKDFEDQLKKYATLTQEELNLGTKEQELATHAKSLQPQKEALIQEKGNMQAQLKKLNQIENDHKKQIKYIATLSACIDDYYTIAQAAGKDGIQALLIEEIIPEIEQEANDLLGRLTDNQTQLFIESLKDLKKGGTKETLDIRISDAVGIRPYEMFSGGEAFRIDFALRIAISKLLARRSGTALQTLIIDEGFGSQDEEGLSLIMDALYKIQDDFSKIIIVSHLATMKDQFPVHFVVEKRPQGSAVRVFEQG